MEETGEWLECDTDNDYEIWSEYPYPIRRKGSDKVISECNSGVGYIRCSLNRKPYDKHRIIAQQFIPNDDPEHKPFIDHINKNRTDNRLENLRWVSRSENTKNQSRSKGYQYVFLDKLPETAEPLEFYNNHEYDDLWIDYGTQKLYLYNGALYRELIEHQNGHYRYVNAIDREGKRTRLSLNQLFG